MRILVPLKIEHFREDVIATLVSSVTRLLLGNTPRLSPTNYRFRNSRDGRVALLLKRPEVLVRVNAVAEEGARGARVEVT